MYKMLSSLQPLTYNAMIVHIQCTCITHLDCANSNFIEKKYLFQLTSDNIFQPHQFDSFSYNTVPCCYTKVLMLVAADQSIPLWLTASNNKKFKGHYPKSFS